MITFRYQWKLSPPTHHYKQHLQITLCVQMKTTICRIRQGRKMMAPSLHRTRPIPAMANRRVPHHDAFQLRSPRGGSEDERIFSYFCLSITYSPTSSTRPIVILFFQFLTHLPSFYFISRSSILPILVVRLSPPTSVHQRSEFSH